MHDAEHLRHSLAENTVDADDHLVARFDDVDDAGLHAGTASAAYGEGETIVRPKRKPQEFLALVHDLQKLRVKMANEGIGHRRQNARVHVAGARSKKDPRREFQWSEIRHGRSLQSSFQ